MTNGKKKMDHGERGQISHHEGLLILSKLFVL